MLERCFLKIDECEIAAMVFAVACFTLLRPRGGFAVEASARVDVLGDSSVAGQAFGVLPTLRIIDVTRFAVLLQLRMGGA